MFALIGSVFTFAVGVVVGGVVSFLVFRKNPAAAAVANKLVVQAGADITKASGGKL